jgi:tetratricopeptide (TPR) repeat protein
MADYVKKIKNSLAFIITPPSILLIFLASFYLIYSKDEAAGQIYEPFAGKKVSNVLISGVAGVPDDGFSGKIKKNAVKEVDILTAWPGELHILESRLVAAIQRDPKDVASHYLLFLTYLRMPDIYGRNLANATKIWLNIGDEQGWHDYFLAGSVELMLSGGDIVGAKKILKEWRSYDGLSWRLRLYEGLVGFLIDQNLTRFVDVVGEVIESHGSDVDLAAGYLRMVLSESKQISLDSSNMTSLMGKIEKMDKKFNSKEIKTSLGIVLFNMGEYSKAASAYSSVLNSYPDDKFALFGYGVLSGIFLKNPTEGIKHLTSLKDKFGNVMQDDEKATNMIYLGYLKLLNIDGQKLRKESSVGRLLQSAVDDFSRAVELSKDNAEREIVVLSRDALVLKHKNPRAFVELMNAVGERGGFSPIIKLATSVSLLTDLGDKKGALLAALDASILDAEDLEIMMQLTKAYYVNGRFAEALAELKKAKAKHPKSGLPNLLEASLWVKGASGAGVKQVHDVDGAYPGHDQPRP